MKAASIQEIKQELASAPAKDLLALCLRLARFKKENKELLTYLLFEAHDVEGYIRSVQLDMDEQFEAVNTSNNYLAKKSFRKILRTVNKYIRHTASAEAEVALLLHYCEKLKSSGINLSKTAALKNLYEGQLKKIKAAIQTLHEDLQFDYQKQLEALQD
jgi:uncharacterized protein YqgV (UPF0045/DUF77 family)